jgi:hypothetical protein
VDPPCSIAWADSRTSLRCMSYTKLYIHLRGISKTPIALCLSVGWEMSVISLTTGPYCNHSPIVLETALGKG